MTNTTFPLDPASEDLTSVDLDGENSTLGALQLVLSEKNASLAVMRTGISVLTLPLAVLSTLIATSKFYQAGAVLHLLLPVVFICLGLIVVGCYMVYRSMRRLRHHDALLAKLKKTHPKLVPFLD